MSKYTFEDVDDDKSLVIRCECGVATGTENDWKAHKGTHKTDPNYKIQEVGEEN